MSANSRVSLPVVRAVAALSISGIILVATVSGTRAGDPRCAAYGPDFAAVEGTDTCMRIGGRVRVDVGTHLSASPNTGWANGALEPAGVRSDSGTAPESQFTRRLRLHDGVATSDPFQH